MLLPSHGVVDFTHVEDCMAWSVLKSSVCKFSDEKMNQFVYYTPCKSICLENLIFE